MENILINYQVNNNYYKIFFKLLIIYFFLQLIYYFQFNNLKIYQLLLNLYYV